jgi:hypothetical protein
VILVFTIAVGIITIGWVTGVAAYHHHWRQNDQRDWDELAKRDRDRPARYDHPSVYEPRYMHIPRRDDE